MEIIKKQTLAEAFNVYFDRRMIKILLLGAGECGKSTVLKQIKYLSKIEVTKNELLIYRQAIRCNAIESIQRCWHFGLATSRGKMAMHSNPREE